MSGEAHAQLVRWLGWLGHRAFPGFPCSLEGATSRQAPSQQLRCSQVAQSVAQSVTQFNSQPVAATARSASNLKPPFPPGRPGPASIRDACNAGHRITRQCRTSCPAWTGDPNRQPFFLFSHADYYSLEPRVPRPRPTSTVPPADALATPIEQLVCRKRRILAKAVPRPVPSGSSSPVPCPRASRLPVLLGRIYSKSLSVSACGSGWHVITPYVVQTSADQYRTAQRNTNVKDGRASAGRH